MVVTRLEYPLGENVPYMIMSLDTMISVKNTVNIGIVRSKIKDELKKTYSFLPVSIGGHMINRDDAMQYINNLHYGNGYYTSVGSRIIKDWIETEKIDKFLISINGIWLDPTSNKWLITVEVYDPDYAD